MSSNAASNYVDVRPRSQCRAVSQLCFLQPPAATDDDSIFFCERFCSLIYNDDDRALHDLSADSTMASPLLIQPTYLLAEWSRNSFSPSSNYRP